MSSLVDLTIPARGRVLTSEFTRKIISRSSLKIDMVTKNISARPVRKVIFSLVREGEWRKEDMFFLLQSNLSSSAGRVTPRKYVATEITITSICEWSTTPPMPALLQPPFPCRLISPPQTHAHPVPDCATPRAKIG